MSLGERFRAAREQRGETLSEVAEHLRIRSVYLAAIEDENWKTIGAPVYIRGFLRTYARYLGLDPEEAVSDFNRSEFSESERAAATAPPSFTLSERRSGALTPLIWLASLVALALIGFVVYLYVTPPRRAAPAAATAVQPAAPSPAPAAAPPTATPAARTLVIHLTAPSWLRVSVDGNVSIEGTFPAGTTRTFHGGVALVRVGNAGGVELTVDGKQIGKLGAAGDVVEKSFTL